MVATLRPLADDDVPAVVALSLAAWAPVFAGLEQEMGHNVFGLVYPDWRSAQAAAVRETCTASDLAWVATVADRPVGFAAVCFVDEGDARAGEISMLAVDPAHQRAGVGAALVERAVAGIGATGVRLAVVATGGDPGHAPARGLYEASAFSPLRQLRYYRTL